MKIQKLQNLGKVKKKLVRIDEPLVIVGSGSKYLSKLEVTKWAFGTNSKRWFANCLGNSPDFDYAIRRSDFESNNELFEAQQRSLEAAEFYVYKLGGHAPKRKHPTYEEASDEANRLAKMQPSETFEVLSVVETVKVEPEPFKWRTDFENLTDFTDEEGMVCAACTTDPEGWTFLPREQVAARLIPFCDVLDTCGRDEINPAPSPFI